MDRYETPYYRAASARRHHVLDAYLSYGPIAAAKIAADERNEKARQWAALSSAVHPVGARRPGAWRCWLGTFLVRAGTRLQGTPKLAADLTPAAS
jgi:hypothetical protein